MQKYHLEKCGGKEKVPPIDLLSGYILTSNLTNPDRTCDCRWTIEDSRVGQI